MKKIIFRVACLTLCIVMLMVQLPLTSFAATDLPIVSIAIDKTLLSAGETTTITIQVKEGYTAKWIYYYRPITDNYDTVYLYETSDNVYEGTFKVDDQTESGVWKVNYFTLKDSNDEYVYWYNSDTFSASYYRDTYDFSSINFEVIGTDADVTPPVINNYGIDKKLASCGEVLTFKAKVTDEHLPSRVSFWYEDPQGESEVFYLDLIDDVGLYQATVNIDTDTSVGLWKPRYISVIDANGNSTYLYNTTMSYGNPKVDLSSLNFEVIDPDDVGSTTGGGSYIVIFKDGYGNVLSTQRVAYGEDAVEPNAPTNELYLFNGWDAAFTNITSDKVINATWVLNPNIVYDKETCVGQTFSIEAYSTINQNYTISCNSDIIFSTALVGSSMTFMDGNLYYGKEYSVTVSEVGSYLFYIDGYWSSNTLTYKVKVSEHNWMEASCTTPKTCSVCGGTTGSLKSHTEVIDAAVAATCTKTGLTEGKHCSVCNTVTVAQQTVPTKAHTEVIDAAVAATCTAAGKTEGKHCSVCGTVTVAQQTVAAKGHTEVVDKAVTATCTASGKTEGKHCSVCGTVIVAQQNIPAAGHTYDNGVDGTCNGCGIHRETTEDRTVMHMFRMYDPNSGEHFYTGSEEERDYLVSVGWNYEGVGFTFSRTTGMPVYRLYDPTSGEHLYTMQEPVKTGEQYEGKDLYECEGRIWLYEGIAFNSAYDTEVPQYRLRNPNATRGAYHFTSSAEERDNLIAAGWISEGICFYSSWK